jgi:hypothetical protein
MPMNVVDDGGFQGDISPRNEGDEGCSTHSPEMFVTPQDGGVIHTTWTDDCAISLARSMGRRVQAGSGRVYGPDGGVE